MKPMTPGQMLGIIAQISDALEHHNPNISNELLVAWSYDKEKPDYNNNWSRTFHYILSYLPKNPEDRK